MGMSMNVMVAMSGGVDSSVAAALLKEQGCRVTGVTMCFNLPGSATRKPGCCGQQGIEDAQAVARELGIPHHVLGFADALEREVVAPFCAEYLRGRTPNPCVWCNERLKFAALLDKARAMGFGHVATGHYARIEQRDGGWHLLKGMDERKDQSYFLYRMGQEQMRHILFPLGELTKTRIRELARSFHLPVADKAESQEVCFVPDDDYRAFIAHRAAHDKTLDASLLRPGDLVDIEGMVLGRHKGAAFYTVGQRTGLGIAHGHRLYVLRIDAKDNRVVVGTREHADAREFTVEDLSWCGEPLKEARRLDAKIRYNHRGAAAWARPGKATVHVECDEPVFAVTPGQSAVFYDGDEVVGGGIIMNSPLQFDTGVQAGLC